MDFIEWDNEWLGAKQKEGEARRAKARQKWRDANPEYAKAYTKEWKKRNPEQYKNQRRKWREDNPTYDKEWLQTAKGKAVKQRGNIARQIRLCNVVNTLTSQEWIDKLIEYNFKCAYCGVTFDDIDVPTIDHIVPISKGGDNTKDNVVPACQSCNSKKGTKILT